MNKKAYKKSEEWLIKNLKYFDPKKDSKIANDKYRVKAFTELIFIQNMFYPKRIFKDKNQNIINKFVLESIKNFSYYEYVLKNPEMLSLLPTVIEFLLNHKSYQFKDYQKVKKLIALNYDTLIDRTAFRKLDLIYSFGKIGIITNLGSLDSVYSSTLLAKAGNSFYYSNIDAYSITHTIFYMTDMGRKENLSLQSKEILDLLLKLIELFLLKDNMDILAELLICVKMLNFRPTDEQKYLLNLAVKVLMKHQQSTGMFLGPGINSAVRYNAEKNFRLNYHTTMVAMGALYLYE